MTDKYHGVTKITSYFYFFGLHQTMRTPLIIWSCKIGGFLTHTGWTFTNNNRLVKENSGQSIKPDPSKTTQDHFEPNQDNPVGLAEVH